MQPALAVRSPGRSHSEINRCEYLTCNYRYIYIRLMTTISWILLTYKVPAEPARGRVGVWRKIKAMGAVYLQNGVCLLPRTDDHLRRLKMLEHEIASLEGSRCCSRPWDWTRLRKRK
jgi:hypothetical protein